jgi:DNA-binding transcriptional LysR family regulator
MEFRLLRYFLAIAREGSISGAANSLNVTQPTLSRQMKDLEEELGHRLFTRSSHSVSLTAEGMRLRKRAEEILEMVNKTKAEFKIPTDNISGDIYIGSGETHGMRLITNVITKLKQDYPDIHYHLYSGNAEDVTERLDKGLLDFGLLIQPTDISKYDTLSLPCKDVWGVIMPKNCELAKKKNVTKRDLINLPLICSRQSLKESSDYNEFLHWFGKDLKNLNIVATYNLLFNASLLVEQGVGYALSLDKLVDIMDSQVCFRPLNPIVEAGLDIVWKKYQVFTPAAKVFLDALQYYLDNEYVVTAVSSLEPCV